MQLAQRLFFRLPVCAQRFLFMSLRREVYLKMQTLRKIDATGNNNSLKSFDEYKFIFVRIPKCATRSVSKGLFNNLQGGHTSIRVYRLVFTPEEFRTYFKFTIVRNPWDRLVSAFLFLKKGGVNISDKQWNKNNLALYRDFDSFVKGWLTRDNIQKYVHFRPQCSFICGQDNRPLVDFIGYIENIEDAFSYICRRIGIERELLAENVNREKRDYKTYYSDETRTRVADVYQEDIRLLGYDFDNSSIREQLLNP